MKRPARVRVLGKQFQIDFVPGDHKNLEEAYGLCDSDEQRIWIKEGQPLESEQDTVLHEVLHAVESAMNMDLDDKIIHLLATGLLAVIRDNPTFVRYLATKRPHAQKVKAAPLPEVR